MPQHTKVSSFDPPKYAAGWVSNWFPAQYESSFSMNICKCKRLNHTCMHTHFNVWTALAIHHHSDLLIDATRIIWWDSRQLWCKWGQLFVYIMHALDGWRRYIVKPIVFLAPFHMLPFNKGAGWGILYTTAEALLTGDILIVFSLRRPPNPQCNLMCLYLCRIAISAGHGWSETAKRGRMHFESCGE